VQFVTSIAWSH